MVNIKGMSDSLVINPNANRMEQKNSAKMVACKDMAGPRPMGSLNVVSRALKSAIFAQPWVIIIREAPNLSSRSATSVPHDEEEKNNFFMFSVFVNVVVYSQN